MSIPQASVSKPAARREIRKRKRNSLPVMSKSPRRASASGQRGKGSGRGNSLPVTSIPRRASAPVARQENPEGETHMLSCQSPGECQQASSGKGSGGRNSHAIMSVPRRVSASRQRGKGSGGRNSHAVTSIPQARVSEPAARRGIRKGVTYSLSFQPPGRASAGRQRD